MKEALRRGYVNADPAVGVESFTEKYKVRGIITPEEISVLFNKDALSSIWKGERVFFVASLLGVATGLRQGEVRGLRNQDVHSDIRYRLRIVGRTKWPSWRQVGLRTDCSDTIAGRQRT